MDSNRPDVDPLGERGFRAVIGATLVLAGWLLVVTWGRWGDPVIDVGRELETAWKVSEGRLLYRDAAYNYGPLSPYVNALLLRVFGLELGVFVGAGLVATAGICLLVYVLGRRFTDRTAALAAVPVVLLTCAFQHNYRNGSFNFVLPYSVPAVHGLLLALGVALCLVRSLDGERTRALVIAGVLSGLALLCKLEIAAAILGTACVTTCVLRRRVWREPWAALRDTAAWCIPAVVVALAGYAPFVLASSVRTVFGENVLRADLVDPRTNEFFLRLSGFDDVGGNLQRVLVSIGFWLAASVAAFASTRVATAKRPAVGAVLAFVVGSLLAFVPIRYDTIYRCLPVLGALVWFLGFKTQDRRIASLRLLGTFAALCFARMLLNAGTHHYGFALAVPALVLLGALLTRELPARLKLSAAATRVFVLVLLVAWSGQAVRHFVRRSLPRYAEKTLVLEGPNGRLRADPSRPRYQAMGEVLAFLRAEASVGEGLVVIPEGASINFLTGLPNPTSFNLFTPPELNAPGVESRLIEELQAAEVPWVVVLDRQVIEFGHRGPGVDYALMTWDVLRRGYAPAGRFGAHPPFAGPSVEGGAVVLRRRP